MTNKDLIDILLAHEPTAQVMFMTTRAQPFENYVAGVVSRGEMDDQIGRVGSGIDPKDIFLVVGRRIRPGSLSAWILAELKQATAFEAAPEEKESAIGAILHNFCSRAFEGDADVHLWEKSGMVRALHAAYGAGVANTAARFAAGESVDLSASDAGSEDITRNVALPALPAPGEREAAAPTDYEDDLGLEQ
jgi:hypothetical protein